MKTPQGCRKLNLQQWKQMEGLERGSGREGDNMKC